MRRAWILALLVAAPAGAQEPKVVPHWDVELDVSDAFDNTQRYDHSTVHTYHFAHATLLLDVEGALPRGDLLRVATQRARVISSSGGIDGGREVVGPAHHARLEYRSTLRSDQVALAISYDAPERWAATFSIGLDTSGTNFACVAHGSRETCADGAVAPLAPLGWTMDPKDGQMVHDGDAWRLTYESHDGRCAAGETKHHRKVTIVLRPHPPDVVMLGRVQR